jgi:hypothetical protein
MERTGWVERTEPALAVEEGWVLKTSLVAELVVMMKLEEVAEERDPEVAARV